MQKEQGFTLIEIMIVVVIVSVLAMVAVPSYQNQMQKARRVDATEALMNIAGIQERYFLQNNGYANDDDNLYENTTENGYYSIAMSNNLPCDAGADRLNCFIIEARPAVGSPQVADEKCAVFTIDNIGRKLALDADGLASQDCW